MTQVPAHVPFFHSYRENYTLTFSCGWLPHRAATSIITVLLTVPIAVIAYFIDALDVGRCPWTRIHTLAYSVRIPGAEQGATEYQNSESIAWLGFASFSVTHNKGKAYLWAFRACYVRCSWNKIFLGFICLFIFNKAVFVLSSVDKIGKES